MHSGFDAGRDFVGLNSLILALQIFHHSDPQWQVDKPQHLFQQVLSEAVKVPLPWLDLRNSRLVLRGPSVPVINAIDCLFFFPGKHLALLQGLRTSQSVIQVPGECCITSGWDLEANDPVV